MKKLLLSIFVLCTISACHDENLNEPTKDSPTASNTTTGKRICPSDKMRAQILKNNPEARARVAQIENQYQNYLTDIKLGKVLADGTVEISVVVNVLYKTAAENLSDSRIQSQIDVLNKDFSGTNSNVSQTPNEFKPALARNTKITFRLAKIVRKQNNTQSWPLDDKMKKPNVGGIGATAPNKNLNIWVVNNLNDSAAGYAYYPGTIGPALDGIVIGSPYFGTGPGTADPYNLGRTTTHEVGHYLNLAHIFGDNGVCSTDYCNDTPPSPEPNFGAPTYPLYKTCGGVSRSQMFMNYMDYTDDNVMCMFTNNQKQRMQAVVTPSGPRSGLRN